jgi:hypothetical protein
MKIGRHIYYIIVNDRPEFIIEHKKNALRPRSTLRITTGNSSFNSESSN